ncbi:MAG: hypothetical protein Ct9H90mP6_03350 [Gammaproteobacteria bacterium]|nr:MAG: hypothetical protein Ct9H90mP6_03350 [Gammaproteobacteria bacterium]
MLKVTETDPKMRYAGCMDGFSLVSCFKDGNVTGKEDDINKDLLQDTDILVTTTGNVNVCDSGILNSLKKEQWVFNIGHFDTEIDTV